MDILGMKTRKLPEPFLKSLEFNFVLQFSQHWGKKPNKQTLNFRGMSKSHLGFLTITILVGWPWLSLPSPTLITFHVPKTSPAVSCFCASCPKCPPTLAQTPIHSWNSSSDTTSVKPFLLLLRQI